MTFTLDHPHNYKLVGFPESEARIVAKDGRYSKCPLIVEYRTSPHDDWHLEFYSGAGHVLNRNADESAFYALINAPAPKLKMFVAMFRVDGELAVFWSDDPSKMFGMQNRISDVVELEIEA